MNEQQTKAALEHLGTAVSNLIVAYLPYNPPVPSARDCLRPTSRPLSEFERALNPRIVDDRAGELSPETVARVKYANRYDPDAVGEWS